ncbi:MAG TPA: hypothetical protein VND93_04925 [Myxococcales bacterium]|jgi:hypothetical protein|nr:hypothetical protein [Myxococcales bacterium]
MARPLPVLLPSAVLVSFLAGCNPVTNPTATDLNGLDGEIIGPGPGGVFTTGCEAVCNASGVICGTVLDPANGSICCCIGGCPAWGPTCAAGVANGTIGPGVSPVGGGVFTANCEDSCNGAGVTCGTVAGANGSTCCCIGSCAWWAQTCAAGVASGQFGPGVAPAPGGGVFTASCDNACNFAGVTCGTVLDPTNGSTCCCIGTCPQNAQACGAGVAAGLIGPGVLF